MSNMKFTLDMEEHKYEQGRNDSRFKFFKKMLMQDTYDRMRDMFDDLVDLGILDKTDYEEDVKGGYKENESGGSGYVNSKDFNIWIKKMNP